VFFVCLLCLTIVHKSVIIKIETKKILNLNGQLERIKKMIHCINDTKKKTILVDDATVFELFDLVDVTKADSTFFVLCLRGEEHQISGTEIIKRATEITDD